MKYSTRFERFYFRNIVQSVFKYFRGTVKYLCAVINLLFLIYRQIRFNNDQKST